MGLDQYLYERTPEQDQIKKEAIKELSEKTNDETIKSYEDLISGYEDHELEIYRWRKNYKLQDWLLENYEIENCVYLELNIEMLDKLKNTYEDYDEAVEIAKKSIKKGNIVYYYFWA